MVTGWAAVLPTTTPSVVRGFHRVSIEIIVKMHICVLIDFPVSSIIGA